VGSNPAVPIVLVRPNKTEQGEKSPKTLGLTLTHSPLFGALRRTIRRKTPADGSESTAKPPQSGPPAAMPVVWSPKPQRSVWGSGGSRLDFPLLAPESASEQGEWLFGWRCLAEVVASTNVSERHVS
jgi:hypothetical protein